MTKVGALLIKLTDSLVFPNGGDLLDHKGKNYHVIFYRKKSIHTTVKKSSSIKQ